MKGESESCCNWGPGLISKLMPTLFLINRVLAVYRLGHSLALCGFLIITVLNVACTSGEDSSPVIATVNGRDIRLSELERFITLKMGEFTSGEAPDSLRSQMLDEYIRRRLLLDEAAREGLLIGDDEIEQAAIDNPRIRSTEGTQESRAELVNDLLIQKFYRQVVLRDVRVAPEEIQHYIEENQGRLTERAGFYVREIRVQSREVADRLHQEVTEGGRDFSSVARLQSDAPNAQQGGLARYDEGQLPKVLERAIKPLRPGDVSPVIRSNFGFHIFKLERRVEQNPNQRRLQLDERRAQLAEELVSRKNQEAVDEAIRRLISAGSIRIDESALGFTYTGALGKN